jgi:HSP20 family molecular chaperone IbpA
MSTDIVDEPLSASYDFCDANNTIIVTLYANGAFEIKDIDIDIDTDSLFIRAPSNEKKFFKFFLFDLFFQANETWRFQLWEHIYSDQVEITTTINSAQTQTSIEIRLPKQQPRKLWPQLYSFGSTPITPERDGLLDEYEDVNMFDQQQYDLSIKKLKTDFFETDQTFTSHIYIQQIRNCQVHFTETNFTAIFYTEYEEDNFDFF